VFTNEEIIHDHTSDTTELGSARVETGEPPGRVQVEWLVGVSGDGVCTLLQPGARLGEGVGVAARPEPFVLQGLGLEKEHLAPFLFLEDQRFEIRFEPVVLPPLIFVEWGQWNIAGAVEHPATLRPKKKQSAFENALLVRPPPAVEGCRRDEHCPRFARLRFCFFPSFCC